MQYCMPTRRQIEIVNIYIGLFSAQSELSCRRIAEAICQRLLKLHSASLYLFLSFFTEFLKKLLDF